MCRVLGERGRPATVLPGPFCCDMRHLVNQGGIPSIIFGPGTIAQAHKPDEHIELREFLDCIEHLIAFMWNWCNQDRAHGQRTGRRDNNDQREGFVMRRVKMRLVWATAFALAIGVTAAQAQQPKRGGTLTYTFHPEPVAISTIATTAVPVALAATKVYESLLEYEGPGLEPKPGLAESWTVSPDRLTYTFRLRDGVKWHDGKPFTSEDVKFSIESIVRPFHSRGRTYFGEVTAIETPDPRTVVFKLKTPVPYLPQGVPAGRVADHAASRFHRR